MKVDLAGFLMDFALIFRNGQKNRLGRFLLQKTALIGACSVADWHRKTVEP
jgi:hypothetical protein